MALEETIIRKGSTYVFGLVSTTPARDDEKVRLRHIQVLEVYLPSGLKWERKDRFQCDFNASLVMA